MVVPRRRGESAADRRLQKRRRFAYRRPSSTPLFFSFFPLFFSFFWGGGTPNGSVRVSFFVFGFFVPFFWFFFFDVVDWPVEKKKKRVKLGKKKKTNKNPVTTLDPRAVALQKAWQSNSVKLGKKKPVKSKEKRYNIRSRQRRNR